MGWRGGAETFSQGRLGSTHLLRCRGTIIHEHHRGEDVDQQSDDSEGVWGDPCGDLQDEPVPVDLTRRLEQGPAGDAVFVLLQPLQLSGCQRLRTRETRHLFLLFPCLVTPQKLPSALLGARWVSLSRPSPKNSSSFGVWSSRGHFHSGTIRRRFVSHRPASRQEATDRKGIIWRRTGKFKWGKKYMALFKPQ